MIISNLDFIPGREVEKTLGVVKGNTIRARHLGKDIMAGFKAMVGGEIGEYTKMIAESREQSLDRMAEQAQQLGADAVLNIRFSTSSVMRSAAEILVYGTAVKLK